MNEFKSDDCPGSWCERATPQQARRLNRVKVLRERGENHKARLMPQLFKVPSAVSIRKLEDAVSRLIHENESLRYVFHRHGEDLCVTSLEETQFCFKEVDAESRLSDAMRTGIFSDFDIRDLADFGEDSPRHLETYLLKGDSDWYYILFLLDHLIADQVACQVFASRLEQLYREEVVDVSEGSTRQHAVDERGRSALKQISELYDSIAVSDKWRDVRSILRHESLLAPVQIPVNRPLSEECSKLGEQNRLLPFSNTKLAAVSARSGVTSFMAFMASVNKALADLSETPGYVYIYPSIREFLDLGDSIGWYAGTSVIEMSRLSSEFSDYLSYCRSEILSSIVEGWAVYELMHSDGVPINYPSLALQHDLDEGHRTLDLVHGEAEPIMMKSPNTVHNSGRIVMTLREDGELLYICSSYEVGRFPEDLTDYLLDETCSQLVEFVESGYPG